MTGTGKAISVQARTGP